MPQDDPSTTEEKDRKGLTGVDDPDAVDPPTPPADPDDDLGEEDWKAAAKNARRDAYDARKKRDELRAELDKREQIDRGAAEQKKREEGKLEELLKEKEDENALLRAKAAKADELEQKMREQLLDRLPKKFREKYESYDVDVLADIVEDFAERPASNGSPGADTANPKGAKPEKWEDMNEQQRAQYLKEHPEDARKLMRQQRMRPRNRS